MASSSLPVDDEVVDVFSWAVGFLDMVETRVPDQPPSDDTPRVRLWPGTEPLPGYRLVSMLGKGGFGEVWKAQAPGGFEVALKFVLLVDGKSDVELRSLELIKSYRHPHLVLQRRSPGLPRIAHN
jgi:serine/threonine protein kinase